MRTQFLQAIEVTGLAIEIFGVLVILVGCCFSTGKFLATYRQLPGAESFRNFRQQLGRAIILGLEFLIAGDIIRTVIVSESLENVGILALIILMRAFLSFTLEMEIEGQLPWSRAPGKREPATPAANPGRNN
ncbi:DUF1622 domain-containing protein [Microbulbifer sediminum]|uniref:DUF1622 domain-containing protein n=1 Tax=Microbulbifer sediminum TaxID=2904250 RepID=UPI001F27313C|nr:DUF1622 domain-containing protein [Microbulbifer sediminum]